MLGKHVMWWSTECTLHTQHRRATAMKPGIRGNIPNSKLPVEKCRNPPLRPHTIPTSPPPPSQALSLWVVSAKLQMAHTTNNTQVQLVPSKFLMQRVVGITSWARGLFPNSYFVKGMATLPAPVCFDFWIGVEWMGKLGCCYKNAEKCPCLREL